MKPSISDESSGHDIGLLSAEERLQRGAGAEQLAGEGLELAGRHGQQPGGDAAQPSERLVTLAPALPRLQDIP